MGSSSAWLLAKVNNSVFKGVRLLTPRRTPPCQVELTALATLSAALRCTWAYLDWDSGERVIGFFNPKDRLTHSIEPTCTDALPLGCQWGFRTHTRHVPGVFERYGKTRLSVIITVLHHYRPPTKELPPCAWYHEKGPQTSM